MVGHAPTLGGDATRPRKGLRGAGECPVEALVLEAKQRGRIYDYDQVRPPPHLGFSF